MDATAHEPATVEQDTQSSGPWVSEPPTPEEVKRAAAAHEEGPIDEPGYGHGV